MNKYKKGQNMFTSFQNWLFERDSNELEYACLMMGADISDWQTKISVVSPKDLYIKDDDFGYEKEPHVTIAYGLHDNEINPNDICEYVSRLWPVKVEISHIDIFECDDYDVVKFDVPPVDQLIEYRKFFMKFPNTQTYDEYHPHITIAYVLPGMGKKYVQDINPFPVLFNTAIYSQPNKNKRYFNLGYELNSRYE